VGKWLAAEPAWFRVEPAALHKRVGLRSRRSVTMMVEAIKTADSFPFAVFLQQSDYEVVWNQAPPSELKGFKATWLKMIIPRKCLKRNETLL
jgi:hypothetical protein